MSNEFTPLQEEIRNNARAVAQEVTAKHAARHDAEYSVPMETLQALHEAGVMRLCIDKRLGGHGAGMLTGVDPLAYLLVIEELGRVDMSAAHCYQIVAHTSQMLTAAGSDEQKQRYLAPAMERLVLFSWTGSEPGRTARGQYTLISEARRTDDGYVLNGVKNFATLANKADWNVVAVTVADMPSPQNFLLAMVPQGAAGFEIDEAWWRPTGMRGAVSPKLKLTEVQVADRDVIQGPGFYPKSQFGARLHLGFAANHLGAAQGLLDFTIAYLPKRGTANNPHSQRAVGEMRMHIEAARRMVYRAALLWQGTPRPEAAEYSLMAKLAAISTAEWMVNETIRVVGSTALLEEYPLHRFARDIHVHSTHANLHNTAQGIGRAALQMNFDPTEQQ
ncbi:MAG: acyl-CoA dehydrogenase family protein [Reyranellaceae bacterium]